MSHPTTEEEITYKTGRHESKGRKALASKDAGKDATQLRTMLCDEHSEQLHCSA